MHERQVGEIKCREKEKEKEKEKIKNFTNLKLYKTLTNTSYGIITLLPSKIQL